MAEASAAETKDYFFSFLFLGIGQNLNIDLKK